MKHSRSFILPFDKAITSFLCFKQAAGLRGVLSTYSRKMSEALGASEYLSWMRNEYVPKRLGGRTDPLSPKTLRNVWITFSSFFVWASREYKISNPMKEVPPPRFQKTPVDVFKQEDIRAMLKTCLYSKEANTSFRRTFMLRRVTAKRDQAILLR